jgi:hypothetical protein
MEEILGSRKQQTPEEGRDEYKDENPESRKRYAPDDGHDSDDESNAVPLKRKKTLRLIPPTDTTILKVDALRDFKVIRKPFRHHYSYLPPSHIRILVIKPRKTDNFYEPLDLELVPELLINPSEPYEALSYEWGDTFPRHKVTVHDSTVSLRDRIDAILSASGTSKETRKLCMRGKWRGCLSARCSTTATARPKRKRSGAPPDWFERIFTTLFCISAERSLSAFG